ncbi:MAG TPA: 50S ribosomal protein L4 [Candidatus Saccharimonadales bacterium]|nr:50S ribosomal protein L4 [Candidatus Saccharimonadales bacterium]
MAEVKKVTSKKETVKIAPKAAVKKEAAPKTGGLTLQAYDMTGKSAGTVTLPKEVFGQKPNKNLLAQAIRVYTLNLSPTTANTKTRGEVRGGGIKPWKQKGTGRARAGSRRSPLWVGGGITFGPRTKDTKLALPQKMKQKALIYALSQKAQESQIKVITNIEKAEAKTKPIAALLKNLDINKNSLLIVSEKSNNLKLATQNIKNLQVETTQNINAYEVMKNHNLLLSKESITKFETK